MPRKKYKKKGSRGRTTYRSRRRYARRKRTYQGSGMTVANKMNTPLPRKFKVNMRYTDHITLDPGAALTASHVFVSNGLYDPDSTGVGHQPYGFDSIMPLYDHYVVIGAKITCTFSNRDASNSQMVGITLRDRTTATTDWRINAESGNTKYTMVNVETAGGSSRTLRYNVAPYKFLGISKPMSADNYRGSISSNPAETCLFHVWATAASAADSGIVDCIIQIDYIAVFIEPVQGGLS